MTTTEVDRLPECPQGHGQMVLRDPKTYTPEQAWCGIWYDCPPGPPGSSCKSSTLLPSAALAAQYEKARGA